MVSVNLVDTAFGMFILDHNGEVLAEFMTFPDVELATAHRIGIYEERMTETIGHAIDAISRLQPIEVVVEDSRLATILTKVSLPVRVEETSKTTRWFRGLLVEYLIKTGKIESGEAANAFLREVSLRLARFVISTVSGKKDLLIKQAIDAIDEIDKCINLMSMRVREWYSLHHPSLSRLVEGHRLFVSLVREGYSKNELKQEFLVDRGVPQITASAIITSLESDVGATLQDSDLSPIRTVAGTVQQLYEVRDALEQYVEVTMNATAPNITALAGPIVGARLISLAGSLQDLARIPSSTVQVLGAEKALFRSFKTGTGLPKHGVIFQVPEVYTAPYWQRGKIARALAGKLALAARIDVFTGRNMATLLREQFQRRVEEIRRQNPQPPPSVPHKSEIKQRSHHKSESRRGQSRRKRRT